MSIFTYVNDILYNKNGKALKKKEMESDFQPYMVQRWISMHSAKNAHILASTTNKVYKSLDNTEQWYKLFLSIVPKSRFKKYRYIKKTVKKETAKVADLEAAIAQVALTKEISKREVRQYVEDYGLNLDELKKRLKECQ